jgi:hypothetical protein
MIERFAEAAPSFDMREYTLGGSRVSLVLERSRGSSSPISAPVVRRDTIPMR